MDCGLNMNSIPGIFFPVNFIKFCGTILRLWIQLVLFVNRNILIWYYIFIDWALFMHSLTDFLNFESCFFFFSELALSELRAQKKTIVCSIFINELYKMIMCKWKVWWLDLLMLLRKTRCCYSKRKQKYCNHCSWNMLIL